MCRQEGVLNRAHRIEEMTMDMEVKLMQYPLAQPTHRTTPLSIH